MKTKRRKRPAELITEEPAAVVPTTKVRRESFVLLDLFFMMDLPALRLFDR